MALRVSSDNIKLLRCFVPLCINIKPDSARLKAKRQLKGRSMFKSATLREYVAVLKLYT